MEKLNYRGLSDEQVKLSRAEHGGNVLPAPVRIPWYIQYLRKFRDPVIRILMIAAVLSCLTGSRGAAFWWRFCWRPSSPS